MTFFVFFLFFISATQAAHPVATEAHRDVNSTQLLPEVGATFNGSFSFADFHGKNFSMKEGEYMIISMDSNLLHYENFHCKLANGRTKEIFELQNEFLEFPEKKTDIRSVGKCGFIMFVDKMAEGTWTLIADMGFAQKLGTIHIVIDPTIVRLYPNLVTPSIINWQDHQMKTLQILPALHLTYWELEKPDGDIIRPSNMSLKSINLDQLTSDDNGIWKLRVAVRNEVFLREQNLDIRIWSNVRYSHTEEYIHMDGILNYQIIVITRSVIFSMSQENIMPEEPLNCIFKNQEGMAFKGMMNREQTKTRDSKQKNCVLNIPLEGAKEVEKKWEVSFDYGHYFENILIDFDLDYFFPTLVWYGMKKVKYVQRGKQFKVQCATNKKMEYCELKNPYGKVQLAELDVIDSKSCSVTIEAITDEHVGNWTCSFNRINDFKIESIIPVKLMESYITTEVEGSHPKNRVVKLRCRTPLTMNYKRVASCKWLHLKERQTVIDIPRMYTPTIRDNVCSLQLKGPREVYFGNWTCIARLDFGGNVNATIILDK